MGVYVSFGGSCGEEVRGEAKTRPIWALRCAVSIFTVDYGPVPEALHKDLFALVEKASTAAAG